MSYRSGLQCSCTALSMQLSDNLRTRAVYVHLRSHAARRFTRPTEVRAWGRRVRVGILPVSERSHWARLTSEAPPPTPAAAVRRWARVRCPTRRPTRTARAEAESPLGPRLLRAKTCDPRIIRVLTASDTSCGGNTRGSQKHGRAYVDARSPSTPLYQLG